MFVVFAFPIIISIFISIFIFAIWLFKEDLPNYPNGLRHNHYVLSKYTLYPRNINLTGIIKYSNGNYVVFQAHTKLLLLDCKRVGETYLLKVCDQTNNCCDCIGWIPANSVNKVY